MLYVSVGQKSYSLCIVVVFSISLCRYSVYRMPMGRQLACHCFASVWVSVAFSAGGIRNRGKEKAIANCLLCVESGI